MRRGSVNWQAGIRLIGTVLLAAATTTAWAAEDDAPPAMAHPAAKLAGTLLRKLPPNDRMEADNLLLKLDLKRDVVYTTGDSPMPEEQQFQFRNNALLTPAKGDARLCVPAELGKYYQLSIRLQCLEKEGDPRVGIGLVFGDRQFLVEGQTDAFSFGTFHGRRVEGKFPDPSQAPLSARFHSDFDVFVGECGWLYINRGRMYEWVGPPKLLALDPKWAVPEKNKVFLMFPDGQFNIIYIKIKSLDRDAWLHQVRQTKPLSRINWAIETEAKKKYPVDVEPLPSHDDLTPTLFVAAREGNFDELEQWAERFRREQSQMGLDFAAWHLYDACIVAYAPDAGRSPPALEPYWQQELAFLDGWRAAKPDSVAARIVAGLVQMRYARSLVGAGKRVPRKAEDKKLFDDRIAAAEKLLCEAAELSPADSCVSTSLLMTGKVRGAPRDEMDKALRRGLAIAPKNYSLYDLMVEYLLSQPGEADTIEKFADGAREGLDEKEGWHVYGRIAEECKRQDVIESDDRFRTLFAGADDKLKSAIPLLIEHYAADPFTVNFASWLCCEFNEPDAARPLFALIKSEPNIGIWGTRSAYDAWRHKANPEAPDSSELLASEGEESVHLQAYSDGLVHLGFLPDSQTLVTASPQLGSVCKFWALDKPRLLKAVPIPRDTFSLLDLRISPTGDLGLLFQDGRETVSGKLRSPDYEEKFGDMHIQRLGRKLQSDNFLSQVVVADGSVTANHRPEGKRALFNVPPKAAAVLSGDGRYLLTVDKTMQLWDTHVGKEVSLPEEVKPKAFCFGRDSSSVIYATGEKLVVWDIAKQQNRFSTTFKEPNLVRTAATSADGRFLATGERRVDADGTKHQVVVLWNLENNQSVHVFDGHRKSVARVLFSPDGQWLASSSQDGIVKVWDVVAATRKDKEAPPKP